MTIKINKQQLNYLLNKLDNLSSYLIHKLENIVYSGENPPAGLTKEINFITMLLIKLKKQTTKTK